MTSPSAVPSLAEQLAHSRDPADTVRLWMRSAALNERQLTLILALMPEVVAAMCNSRNGQKNELVTIIELIVTGQIATEEALYRVVPTKFHGLSTALLARHAIIQRAKNVPGAVVTGQQVRGT